MQQGGTELIEDRVSIALFCCIKQATMVRHLRVLCQAGKWEGWGIAAVYTKEPYTAYRWMFSQA